MSRILFLNGAFLPDNIGGVELHLYHLAQHLRRAGHEPLVVYREYEPEAEEYRLTEDTYEGLKVARLNHRFTEVQDLQAIVSVPAIDRKLGELLDRFRPDLVHVHHFTTFSTTLAREVKRRGIPLVVTLHDFWLGCPRGQRIRADLSPCPKIDLSRCDPCLRDLWPTFFEEPPTGLWARLTGVRYRDLQQYHATVKSSLGEADRLIVPSEFCGQIYRDYGLPGDRMKVVPYGLNGEALRGLKRTPSERFRFGYIGTVIPSKGVHILLDAFLRFPEGAAQLDIHGGIFQFHHDATYGERLHAAAGDRSDVTFHGRYTPEDLPEIFSNLDALIVPSIWYETYCMAMREGFLADVPVIASGHGALAEGVEDGETGLLFEAGNSAHLFLQMERLRSEPALRERLVRSPKEIWSLTQNAEAVTALYRELGFGEKAPSA
ncbi:MAG: glycosyltransferase family 4 protein [Planctomycetota bacterium]